MKGELNEFAILCLHLLEMQVICLFSHYIYILILIYYIHPFTLTNTTIPAAIIT